MIDELGHALAAVCGDRDVLARIGGALGASAQAGLVLDQAGRARAMATVRTPIPAGLRGIDGSWIEAALADLPERARAALADGRAVSPADVWLVRRACGALVPLPAIDAALARPRLPIDVLRMSVASLRAWLVEAGRDQLAFALGEHAAALGDELAPALARIARAPRFGELGPRRAAVDRARGESFVIGVRALAPHLEPAIARGLVLRFPYAEGRALARELATHASASSASWAAVTAR